MQFGTNNGKNSFNFNFNPVPKPNYPRRIAKRGERARFSQEIREEIIERDQGLCIRCQKPAAHVHHIRYRSQLGRGLKRNGVCVCYTCHVWAHQKREGREWFEHWSEVHLDLNGDVIENSDEEEAYL
ncbi:HNH endonuclease [Ammoniphilus sp. CFH 90114]|uniref:HNH endonuclease n=1 Tax=Ammoniphilus sp. CFH 90114 TaxID=2493665 RepID=UPI00100DBF3B|nr:HNH endonuclease [Ammoniphilus sp. CFH 90114]RXT02767.1 hypothetical protein EIZ39_24545 [Ammoniphilus sp. CFH 90114]